jgi:hypothetical protein
MRFMVQVRATRDSEAGKMPSAELVAAMGKFNEEMMNAGVMLAGEGLHPTAKGARIVFAGGEPKVVAPPFAGPGELVSGFWIIDVDSLETAIGWMKRAPFGDGQVLEIRQVFEASDFPADILPPEEAAKEQAWRDAQQPNVDRPGG